MRFQLGRLHTFQMLKATCMASQFSGLRPKAFDIGELEEVEE